MELSLDKGTDFYITSNIGLHVRHHKPSYDQWPTIENAGRYLATGQANWRQPGAAGVAHMREQTQPASYPSMCECAPGRGVVSKTDQ